MADTDPPREVYCVVPSSGRSSRGVSFSSLSNPVLGGVRSRPRMQCPATVDNNDDDEGRSNFEPRTLLADWADNAEKTADDHRDRAVYMKKLNIFFNLSIVGLSSASIVVSNFMAQSEDARNNFLWPLSLSVIGAAIALMRAAENSVQPLDKQGRHSAAAGEYNFIASDIKTTLVNGFYSYKNSKHAVRLFRARLTHADDTTVAI